MKKIIRITTVPAALIGLLNGQLEFMAENGFDVTGVCSPGERLEELKSKNIKIITIPITRQITLFADLRALWLFYKLCKKEKPDIVHSHTPKAGIIGMLGAKLAGVPIRLHTVAGLPLMEATGIKRKILNGAEKIIYHCAHKIYPNSIGLYNFILNEKFTTPDKLKVIANGSSNGIDTSEFDPMSISEQDKDILKQHLGIGLKDFVFVFVGRLVRDKGINELVEAFEILQLENFKIKSKLLLVGPFETELDPLLPQTLKKIEMNPNIIAVGIQRDVRPYLAISHALSFPSYREGFPNVVMQAGAMGLPSIVTDINGCNEIIEKKVNGIIIPSKNAIALKKAMLELMDDGTLFSTLKSNAREMIISRFEQKSVWDAILKEYKVQQEKRFKTK